MVLFQKDHLAKRKLTAKWQRQPCDNNIAGLVCILQPQLGRLIVAFHICGKSCLHHDKPETKQQSYWWTSLAQHHRKCQMGLLANNAIVFLGGREEQLRLNIVQLIEIVQI